MQKANIIETNLEFGKLYARECTDMLVIHHTGNAVDDDMSARQIHRSHKNNGWTGIGYHYVVRKDGSIERGRPHWSVGAHAYPKRRKTPSFSYGDIRRVSFAGSMPVKDTIQRR